MDYQPRIVDGELVRQLQAAGMVVLEGPKAVGKTATAQQKAASVVRLDTDEAARAAAEIDPGLILPGETPRLIDEWQVVPGIWNHLRRAVDDRQTPGQFILTGSAVPADDATRHTGAGRTSRLRVRPMTFFELGYSAGETSLSALFNRASLDPASSDMSIPELVNRVCIGGWPAMRNLTPADAQQALRNYLDEVARTDIHRVDGVARNPAKVRRVLRSLGRNVGTQAAATVIADDTADDPEAPVERRTIADYVDALARLMVVEDQPSWSPRLRSRSQPRAAPKRHFVDPCLAVAATGASPQRLLADLNTFGFLFESLVVRDLRVYVQPLGGQVLHYRDNTGLEVDAVVELPDGSWAGIEVKLGLNQVDAAADALTRFRNRVDTTSCGEPAFLAVVVANGYAYQRPDGIVVLPVATLGP